MSAEFEAFTRDSGLVHISINHYRIEQENGLTDRACEVNARQLHNGERSIIMINAPD